MFEHRVEEKTEIRKRSEMWTAEINDFDVYVLRDDDGGVRINIHRGIKKPLRVGMLQLSPKSVADLEAFAAEAGALLAEIARGMRDAGLDDLRSSWEKSTDEFEARLARQLAAAAEGAPE